MRMPGKQTLERIYRRYANKGIILLYHRVAADECDPWFLAVTPDHFAEQLDVINRYAEAVTFHEMAQGLGRPCLGEKQVVLTFDDGYVDNYQNAIPALERQGVPGTFFVSTGPLKEEPFFWWEDLATAILTASALPAKFEELIGNVVYSWDIAVDSQEKIEEERLVPQTLPENNSRLSPIRLYYALWKLLVPLSYRDRCNTVQKISAWAGPTRLEEERCRVMTHAELSLLAKNPLFEIGGHTVCHPHLSHLSPADQEKEIGQGKRELEEIINRPITSFSYPHGDFSEETVRIVKRMKFQQACTVASGRVGWRSDPLLLPRFGVDNWTGEQFEKILKRWLA